MLSLLAAIAVAVLLYAQADLSEPGVHMMIVTLGMLMVLGKACSQTTGTVTSEREGRTWDVLLSTPLPAREILAGKALGGLARMWIIPSLIMLHFGVISLATGFMHAEVWFILPPLLLGTSAFLCCSGVAFSLWSKKSTGASTMNFLLAGGLWLGVPIFLTFLAASGLMGRTGELHRDLMGLAQGANPIGMAVTAMNGLTGLAEGVPVGASSGRDPYVIGPWSFSTGQFVALSWAFCAVYALAGFAFLTFAAARFNRAAGRTS